jgi:hypothetical protein
VNKVAFRLLGVLPGMVTLKGTIAPEPEGQGTWVRASFEKPKLSLLGLPALTIGPTSSVVLATTFLDSRVRLGEHAG